MRLVEIFNSIEGEGKRTGQLTTFVRLAGCNLQCSYCDTEYAQSPEAGNVITKFDNIIAEIKHRNVTLTGGEPLLHPDSDKLIKRILKEKVELNIETNGSIDLWNFSNIPHHGNMFFTMDYKVPSSGMQHKMIESNLDMLSERDVIKFVVGNKSDLDFVWDLLDTHNIAAQKYISPVFGKIDPRDIVMYMQLNEMDDCILQLQMHKLIWDSSTRGV